MLNFKRKRVLNPILMLKSIILSVFIGAFTVAASLSVDAAQISLEEELAILTGRDNHSKYLPNDSEEEEEDYYEPSERSMMLEYIPQVDIPPTENYEDDDYNQAKLSISRSEAEVDIPLNNEYKIFKAYEDGLSAAKKQIHSMDFFAKKNAPTTKKEYKAQIEYISFWANAGVESAIRTYSATHSKEETEAFAAQLKDLTQKHMFEQIKSKEKPKSEYIECEPFFATPFVLRAVPEGNEVPEFVVNLNERNKQKSKRGDLCLRLFSKCDLI